MTKIQFPNLQQSLKNQDKGHLQIIADLWGLDVDVWKIEPALESIVSMILNRTRIHEIVNDLPDQAQYGINELVNNQGFIAWSLFTRRYGDVREMGHGRRDREKPYKTHNASTAEILWYRALVYKGFFDIGMGPEEFAYIPRDLLEIIPGEKLSDDFTYGCEAVPFEYRYPLPVNDWILDDACTMLAGIRMGMKIEKIAGSFKLCKIEPGSVGELSVRALIDLLSSARIMGKEGELIPERVKTFLEAERGSSLNKLVQSWLDSKSFNELHLLPGLFFEGEWKNNPLRARQAVLEFLSTIPKSPVRIKILENSGSIPESSQSSDRPYWSLKSFISDIHTKSPDFQRTAGEYDSWYIREKSTGNYLNGFEHWDQIEGALIRYILTGPLNWLGIIELAGSGDNVKEAADLISAFRFSDWAYYLLHDRTLKIDSEEDGKLIVRADGVILVPDEVPRSVRYQIARFCEWGELNTERNLYTYLITNTSLSQSQQKNLKVEQLINILTKYSASVPPNLIGGLKRWDTQGSSVSLENHTILRMNDPQIIEDLRKSRAARFIGEALGPNTVIVKNHAWKRVLSVLTEMGYFSKVKIQDEENG